MKHIQVPKAVIFLSCLSMVIVTASILLNIVLPGRVSGAQSEDWELLSTLLEPEKLLQIVTDNTAPSADRRAISQSAVGAIEGDLLVVDFNSSSLCGRGGCAIAAYRVSTGELPCLLLAPPVNTPELGATRDTLCYQDGEWVTEGS